MLLFIASLQNTGGATNLTPGVGTLAITGFAPTVAQTVNQALTPSAGALTLTGFAPTLAQPQAVTPSVGALAVTGYAPTLAQSANQTLTPNAGALTLTGFAPTVTVAAAGGSDTKNPTTATQTASVPWLFLSNILACDLALAVGGLYPPAGTITTGSFGLSAAGPITGYKIEISCYATNDLGGSGKTAYLRPSLKLGGNSYFPAVTPTLTTFPTGTALSDPTQLQTVSWGGATATWYNESTGSPATFSSSDLAGAQVVLLFDEDPGPNDEATSAYIDCVRLTVYYAAAANATPGAGLLTVTGYAPNVAQTSGATKVGGDDVPRAEIWTTRKAKAVRKRIARELVELKAAAPDLVAGLAVPALQPDWSAYVAQLQAVAAELEVLQARRWEEWLEEDDEDILLLL